MPLHRQAVVWSWGFAAFAAMCVLAAWRSKDGVDAVRQTEEYQPAPNRFQTNSCGSVWRLALRFCCWR